MNEYKFSPTVGRGTLSREALCDEGGTVPFSSLSGFVT